MIPITEKIALDEMITSWVQHLAKINDMPLQLFYRYYLGYRKVVKNCDFHPSKTCLENLNQLDTGMLSDFFPSVSDILRYHTPLYMLLPTWKMGYQVRTFEYHLRNSLKNDVCIKPYLIYKYKVCPECMNEDITRYGRVVIHVPHQSDSAKACWKHKVHLVEYDGDTTEYVSESATEAEFHIAKFIHELYENPLFTCAEDLQTVFDKYLLEHEGTTASIIFQEMKSQGYFTMNRNMKGFGQFLNEKKTSLSLNTLCYLYKDVETVHRMLINENIKRVSSINNSYNSVYTDGVLSKVKCGACSREFYTHYQSATYGLGCPYCAESISQKEMVIHSVFDFNTVVDVKTDTEKVREMWAKHLFTNKPGGQRIRYAKQRLGEQVRNRSGEMMTITAYRGSKDIDVQFEDGTVVEHVLYQNFVKGYVEKP